MDTKAYVSTLHSRGSFHWTENSEESENYAAFCEVNLLPCRVVSVACTVLFLPDYLPKISSLISYLLKLTLTTTTITRAALHMYNGSKKNEFAFLFRNNFVNYWQNGNNRIYLVKL